MDSLVEINAKHRHARKYRGLKLELLSKFGVCHWCKRVVRDVIAQKGMTPPDDQATVDHMVSRFFRRKGEEVLKVLACYRCNQDRARRELRAMVKVYKHHNGKTT